MKTIIIEVKDGVVDSVYADEEQTVLIIDHDIKHDNPEEEEAFETIVNSSKEHIIQNNLKKLY